MIKFLHCADVHLDSPLSCLSHAVGERLRDALKQTFLDMLTFAKEENLSMVLIAGQASAPMAALTSFTVLSRM